MHKETGKEAGLGFTYKRLSNGLFEVSRLKEGGAALESGLLQPKDVRIPNSRKPVAVRLSWAGVSTEFGSNFDCMLLDSALLPNSQ